MFYVFKIIQLLEDINDTTVNYTKQPLKIFTIYILEFVDYCMWKKYLLTKWGIVERSLKVGYSPNTNN